MLERVIRHNASNKFRIAAFFDDNPKVHGKRLNGIPVFNPQKSFSKMVAKYGIEVVILGIRDLPPDRRASFINQCLAHHIQVLKLPPVESWLHGELNLRQLKTVNLEDLLGRAPILLDEAALRASIQGKTVMVTGCAGSIGSEILRQLLKQEPAFVLGVDQAESPLAEIALELKGVIEQGRFRPVVGDVRDSDRMARLFEEYRPEHVFHAAAYKHVPIMEDHPEEAIKSNVLGSRVLADLAVQHRSEKFVMISTDKAVNPSNVMGATKRIAEMYVQALNYADGCATQFITTRFGNVLGSNGSVIPIFKEQIEKGLPLTVTHPDIKRFFMTIPEACSLVLEASAMGHGGEIFVFDMGEQVRILDLAHRMIQIYGLTPGKDVEIQFVGLRPGEKLYEELLDHKETLAETYHPKIYRAQVRPGDFHQIRSDIDLLIAGAQNGWRPNDLVQTMKTLVPEFISQNSVFSELDNKDPRA
ncbi:MAG: polysaccharide biosynthesis protein [Haliscomenobacter sp.]|nr:polysaccharide biosynthesis protein [Haliscomenobacter sp.]